MSKALVDDTVAFLHVHGIRLRPEKLDAMVAEALRRLRANIYPGDARGALTKHEAQALKRGGLDLSPEDLGEDDPLARTVSEYAALLKDSLTTAEAAAHLGVHPSRIRQRLISDPPTLYGIRLSDGSWRVPRFQLDGDDLLPGIGEVVAEIEHDLHPIAVQRWFTMPSADLLVEDPGLPLELLGKQLSPRDWLRHGLAVRTVADLARKL